MIELYTDGASKGNPGPGGYGVILKYKAHRKELCGAFQCTTNNRMELMAVIVGLEAIKAPRQQVFVYSDSKYVVDAVCKGWLRAWLRKNFINKKNADLWKRLWTVYQRHVVHFKWIKGHAGHPENERCDQLATQSVERTSAACVDDGYTNQHVSCSLPKQ